MNGVIGNNPTIRWEKLFKSIYKDVTIIPVKIKISIFPLYFKLGKILFMKRIPNNTGRTVFSLKLNPAKAIK
jgi:hypothetical protein